MLEYGNGGRLVQHIDELPDLLDSEHLFLDFETTSGNPKLDSLNPWHSCDVLGICITADEIPGAWYVPVGHRKENLPKDAVYPWLRWIIGTCENWVNHHVKYDAHVFENCIGGDLHCDLVDTIVLAKIVDSDRIMRGGYGLDALSKAWLDEDISRLKKVFEHFLERMNKDWGVVPPDLMGEYGCQDVITNRRLYKYILSRIPEQCQEVVKTEIQVTRVLFDIEQKGMRINPTQLKIKEYQTLNRLLQIDVELTEIVGRSFNPVSPTDCFEVLCGTYGLPVLSWTNEDDKTGTKPHNPSFDKAALVQYAHHPHAPKGVVPLIQEYRSLSTLNSLFLGPYQELHNDCILHGTYNQVVRTGRMSGKEPNFQQLNKTAKELILPPEGYSFLSCDYSQIEFRIIVHYINDETCIRAYNENPNTDFHAWVAEMVGITRGPGKTLNLSMAFGMGKKKATERLAANADVVGKIQAEVDGMLLNESEVAPMFDLLCKQRAEDVYKTYHETLPNLKRTSNSAASALRKRGYVWNLYGRHRHLPRKVAHIAFNTLCQSTAADLMKERVVALHAELQGTPIYIVALVHDDVVMCLPTKLLEDKHLIPTILNLLENPRIKLRVPIRCSAGYSDKNWKGAGLAAKNIDYGLEDVVDFERWRTTRPLRGP
ncbi:hypothetical protein LCGC14_0357360 [marine sediment metagenome]|uniref:DNA-directed DNA polymerase family A palm domain-containing protein n=1 Tax=marine sediment metagenome TaxID=412755 RepID=A0A0F9TS49_9ZZZZ